MDYDIINYTNGLYDEDFYNGNRHMFTDTLEHDVMNPVLEKPSLEDSKIGTTSIKQKPLVRKITPKIYPPTIQNTIPQSNPTTSAKKEVDTTFQSVANDNIPIKKPQRKKMLKEKPSVVPIDTEGKPSATDRIIDDYYKINPKPSNTDTSNKHRSTPTVVPTSSAPKKQTPSTNPDTDPDMFNKSDVDNLKTKNYTEIATQIAGKIKLGYKPPIYECKPDTYTNIYALSDIHADYKTLLTKLYNLGIIGNIKPLNDNDSIRNFFIQGLSATWEKPKSLLIICGDIIDGCRETTTKKTEVTDPDGTCEILLHMFLRNLKLKAQDKGSDVILLLGNHDQDLFMNTEYPGKKTYYKNFSHKTSQDYFGSYDNKLTVLRHFYKNFTYFFGVLKNATTSKNIEKYDLIFVHAGIHPDHNDFYLENHYFEGLVNKQKSINYNNNQIDVFLKANNGTLYNHSIVGALWTRGYTESYNFKTKQNPKAACTDFKELPTIIVGHCPNYYHKYKQNKSDERPCTQKGEDRDHSNCIYPKCFHDNNPKIINIDTVMSEAFGTDQDPNSEILFIEKNNGTYTFSSMFLKNNKVRTYDLIHAKQDGSKGGKKRKTTRRTTRKTTRKSTRKTKRKTTRRTKRKTKRKTARK